MNTYSLIGVDAAWITHKATAGNLTGEKPQATVTVPVTYAEPAVTGAAFTGLAKGGLWAFDKKGIVVEAFLGTGFTIVGTDGSTVLRPTPVVFPFKLGPNEWLKNNTLNEAGVLCRLDATRMI